MCLLFPGLVGVVTVQAVQCEAASAIFSMSCVFPSVFSRGLYFVSMLGSTVLAVYLTRIVWAYEAVPLVPFRATYVGLAVLIVLIRVIGLVMQMRMGCVPPPSEAVVADREKTKKA